MKIIVGLGNPGKKYEFTRHNAGFLFLDHFASLFKFPEFFEKWNALVSEGSVNGEKILLIKPQSFMNLSGDVVSKFLNFYKIDLEDLLVVYDDIDLKLGDIRYRDSGGAGTHNGMRSVVEKLGGGDFSRLRLGVETRTEDSQIDISDFVLSRFPEDEYLIFNKSVHEAARLVEKSLAST